METPAARFVGSGGNGVQLDNFFRDHSIVFTNTFCGDWAGREDAWGLNNECSALAPTCVDYVNKNPTAYEDAYWTVFNVELYKKTNNKQYQGVPVDFEG